MIDRLKERWNAQAGYRQLLKVSFPLMLSTGSISVMLFVDRMLLSWHSTESIAAVLPAGILNWAFLCPFFGTCMYTSTFVAQYVGAGKPERVGATIWHGLLLAVLGGLYMPLLGPFADDIFALFGLPADIQQMETSYFRILNFCAVFFLANTVFSCFFSGRGRSWTIVWVNVLVTALNTLFDYALIFGNFGFPRLGIVGAGYATMISSAIVCALYAYLVMRRKHDAKYATRRAWRFDRDLFARLVRFGAPSGAHFFLDVLGMTVFILLIGKLGAVQQAATNITHQIHLLGLLPLVGVGIATSVLVGQFQGAGRSDLAEKTTYSALQLTLAYNAVVSLAYLIIPELFIAPFLAGRQGAEPEALVALSIDLLKFVAAFTVFESLVILSSSTLKGAGDTAFVMKTLAFTSIGLMVVPSYLVIEVFKLPIYYAWGCLLLNLGVISIVFSKRFRSGKWKSIHVIEQ